MVKIEVNEFEAVYEYGLNFGEEVAGFNINFDYIDSSLRGSFKTTVRQTIIYNSELHALQEILQFKTPQGRLKTMYDCTK